MLDNTSSKMVLSSIHLDFQPVAPGYIFQVFLRVTIEDQVCIRQRIIFRGKQWIRSVFRRTQKIRTLLLSEKSSDFVVVVHLQGLEPRAN